MMDFMYSDYMNNDTYSTDGQKEEIKGNVVFHPVPFKNAVIMLMNHPSSVTLYNHVSVEVLSGSVSLFGYEINQQSPTINVFSSEKTGLIEIKTESYDRIWKKKAQTTTLQYIIRSILPNEKTTKALMEKFGNSTVAVYLRIVDFPMSLKFLGQYYPSVLKFNLYDAQDRYMLYVPDHHEKKCVPIKFGVQQEKLSAEINSLIRSASLNDINSPRIIVCGSKNTGKSSLIRFLINKILSEHTEVCHLETDSGQTEFTPPGVFSLTKLSEPVIGPPFFHQQKPISMVFSGSVSPTSPVVCERAVNELMHLYSKEFKMIPLLVNTIGWMEGVGLECLGSLIKIVKPTVLVEIVTEEECSFFDYREFLPENSSYHQICCSHNPKNSYFSPKELREMSLLSYFSNCQPNTYIPTMPLNKVRPHCVSWDNIAIYSYHNRLLPSRMVEAMIESVVALCTVPKFAILQSKTPLCPKTLEEDPVCECLGYGFVVAADEVRRLLHVISPISEDEWKNVNAIIKGNVAVPDCLILNQDIYESELPYTDAREKILENDTDEEMADYSMVSLKSFSAAQSPSIALASPICYNRAIPKRYHRKRK